MHIAIITGGISSERMVALRSSENMKDWILRAGHTCEVFDFPFDIHQFLQRHQATTLAKHFPTKDLKKHRETHQDFDLTVPMFHGVYGEDGQVTAFLKTLDYQVAYSPFDAHALCIDKNLTNLFVEKMGIKIPKTIFLGKKNECIDTDDWMASCLAMTEILPKFDCIVKPNRGGSSLSTSKVHSIQELQNACEHITDDDILVQECIEGREFTVGVYRDTTGYHTLPIMEIITHDGVLFDYREKYETDGYNEIFPDLPENLENELSLESEKISEMLHCQGVVRIDYRYDGKNIYFLEVNTIPGFTSGSFIPKMWKRSGKNEKEFIEMLTLKV